MISSFWKLVLVALFAWAGVAYSQTPSPKAGQPSDWHDSWDKPYEIPALNSDREKLDGDTNQPAPAKTPGNTVSFPISPRPEERVESEVRQVSPAEQPHISGEALPMGQPDVGNRRDDWIRGVSWETSDQLSYDLHLIWED